MNKTVKAIGAGVVAASLLTGCMGQFALTKKVYNWNKKVDSNRWVQEGVFVAFLIIPVYSITFLIDGVIANSVEWWTGDNPVAQAGDQKRVIGADGSEALMTLRANGEIDVQATSADGSVSAFTLARGDDGLVVKDERGLPLGVTSL